MARESPAFVPVTDARGLGREVRRTTLLRLALALTLALASALTLAVAFQHDVRQAPLIPSGTTGIVVLDLSASVYEGALEQTVEKLAQTDERTGLVVFSDSAYELLPPGSPARELFPLLRFFKVRDDGSLPPNPWDEFRAGTQIATGLRAAHQALRRESVSNGSVVLVSDLEILGDQLDGVTRALADLRNDGVQIRIVPLSPSEEKRALVESLVGRGAFLAEPEDEQQVVASLERFSVGAAAPWLFVFAAAALVLLVAVNERVMSRLGFRV